MRHSIQKSPVLDCTCIMSVKKHVYWLYTSFISVKKLPYLYLYQAIFDKSIFVIIRISCITSDNPVLLYYTQRLTRNVNLSQHYFMRFIVKRNIKNYFIFTLTSLVHNWNVCTCQGSYGKFNGITFPDISTFSSFEYGLAVD